MNQEKADARVQALRQEYRRLTGRLARLSYISEGTVTDRSRLRPPRSGYQWTRKVKQKTITVALSADQFRSLDKAIANRRVLQKTIKRMERISRQILFETVPDTVRRKPLRKRVLGTV